MCVLTYVFHLVKLSSSDTYRDRVFTRSRSLLYSCRLRLIREPKTRTERVYHKVNGNPGVSTPGERQGDTNGDVATLTNVGHDVAFNSNKKLVTSLKFHVSRETKLRKENSCQNATSLLYRASYPYSSHYLYIASFSQCSALCSH